MTTNPPDRIDQIAALLQETVQITHSNASAITAQPHRMELSGDLP